MLVDLFGQRVRLREFSVEFTARMCPMDHGEVVLRRKTYGSNEDIFEEAILSLRNICEPAVWAKMGLEWNTGPKIMRTVYLPTHLASM